GGGVDVRRVRVARLVVAGVVGPPGGAAPLGHLGAGLVVAGPGGVDRRRDAGVAERAVVAAALGRRLGGHADRGEVLTQLHGDRVGAGDEVPAVGGRDHVEGAVRLDRGPL